MQNRTKFAQKNQIQYKKMKKARLSSFSYTNGRNNGIRTHDLLVPNQAHYQAVLYPGKATEVAKIQKRISPFDWFLVNHPIHGVLLKQRYFVNLILFVSSNLLLIRIHHFFALQSQ